MNDDRGETPNAITSESESSSAPKRLCPFSMRAIRPSMPSSTPAMITNATARSQSPLMAKFTPVRPEQSASAVTAFGITALSGIPRGGRTCRLTG
jgi:hypothetical protein